MPKNKPPRLLVFFDTNVLFTQVASDLVKNDVRKIIEENSNHVDLDVSWRLPAVVVEERRFQMLSKGRDLLPNLQKLEKLLGHSFGVGDDTLELHVENAISKSLKDLGIEVVDANTDEVDWKDIISRATSRRPPFEPGDKEKGFRDAVIAQSFLQTLASNPTTPNICRLVFVTSDQRLSDYIEEQSKSAKNVRLLNNLDELESLINTLVSKVSEEFAEELTKKASKMFFVKQDDKTLYYKETVKEKIRDQYSEVFDDPIIDGCLRDQGTWWISEPIFVKKVRQRVHWISMVEPAFEIYHYEDADSPPDNEFGRALAGLSGLADRNRGAHGTGEFGLRESAVRKGFAKGLLSQALSQSKVTDIEGRDRFEVHWSASLSQAKNLTRPSIDEIKYEGYTLSSDS